MGGAQHLELKKMEYARMERSSGEYVDLLPEVICDNPLRISSKTIVLKQAGKTKLSVWAGTSMSAEPARVVGSGFWLIAMLPVIRVSAWPAAAGAWLTKKPFPGGEAIV
jgi:hypothetical protein